jgi:hypothetical protein
MRRMDYRFETSGAQVLMNTGGSILSEPVYVEAQPSEMQFFRARKLGDTVPA